MPVFAASMRCKRPYDPIERLMGSQSIFGGDYFAYLQADRIAGASSDLTMQGYTADRASWLVRYPDIVELIPEAKGDASNLLQPVKLGMAID